MTRWQMKPLKEFDEAHPARVACTAIAMEHGIEFDELFRRCRDHRHSTARAACFARLREAPFKWSLPKIGAAFAMDHSTVLYHVSNYAERRRINRNGAHAEHVSP